jgi:Ca2+-dependent lipid-binding protein
LELVCFRAEDLPKMDTFGTCDAYVQVKFSGNPEIKTEIIKNTFTPVWNEQLNIPGFFTLFNENKTDTI